MALRRLSPDEVLRIERENEKLRGDIDRLKAELAEARGEKPTPPPVVEEITEDTARKPKGKGSE